MREHNKYKPHINHDMYTLNQTINESTIAHTARVMIMRPSVAVHTRAMSVFVLVQLLVRLASLCNWSGRVSQ